MLASTGVIGFTRRGARHPDGGFATGWFLDQCSWPVEKPQITRLDLNENSLAMASKRIRRSAPATVPGQLERCAGRASGG